MSSLKVTKYYFTVFFFFLGLHQQHMEVPGLEVKSELQLPAHTTAIATPRPSHICDLHCSLWQHQILNPLSEARDRTCILMDLYGVLNNRNYNGNSRELFLREQYWSVISKKSENIDCVYIYICNLHKLYHIYII